MTLRQALVALLLAALAAPPAGALSIKDARSKIIAGTLPYLAVPYLWGGESPQTGFDCSGFVQLVYRKVGLGLPRTSNLQYAQTVRLKPKDVRPGDLVFFSMKHPGANDVDHVGIYVGKGFFVQAGVSTGIHIDSLTNPYYQQRLVGIRKFRGF